MSSWKLGVRSLKLGSGGAGPLIQHIFFVSFSLPLTDLTAPGLLLQGNLLAGLVETHLKRQFLGRSMMHGIGMLTKQRTICQIYNLKAKITQTQLPFLALHLDHFNIMAAALPIICIAVTC